MIETSSSHPTTEHADQEDSRVWNRSVLIILTAGLIGRLIVLHSIIANRLPTWLFSHPYEMGLLANSILHGHGLTLPSEFPPAPPH